MKNITFTLILFLLLCLKVNGQEKKGFQILVSHENDVLRFLADNKDENYTGAFKLDLLTPVVNTWQPFYRFSGKETYNAQRFSVGGTGYTPEDLEASNVLYDDRPYASIVFLSLGAISISEDITRQINSNLIIGAMGWSAPGEVQSYLHENEFLGTERPIPNGWDNQIGYDGSFVINYNAKFTKLTFKSGIINDKFEWVRGSYTLGADVGTYMNNLKAGFAVSLFNFNFIESINIDPSMPKFFEPSKEVLKENKGLSSGYVGESKKIRFNFFMAPELRFVAYNTTLQGLIINDDSPHTIDHSDINRFVLDVTAGFNIVLCDAIYLRYATAFRTQEYSGGKKRHHWGEISIGFSPRSWYGR